jgi:hypothetical protein
MPWEWPSDPPAYVFAEDSLGIDQETLLTCVYSDGFARHRADIMRSATLRAFAKALLVALVLHVLFGKLREFVRLAPTPLLDNISRDYLGGGLFILRDCIAGYADGDRLVFVRNLACHVSRGLALFRQGRPPPPRDRTYRPIGMTPIHQIAGDPMLEAAGQRELAVALALIGLVVRSGAWTVMVENPALPKAGTLAISGAGRKVRLFFVAGGDAAVRLRLDGRVSGDDDDVVVVQSSDPVQQLPRSPRPARGRIGRSDPRVVGMAALLGDAGDPAHLIQRFREEVTL